MMRVKAIAPWFGGKRNLAAAIVEALGKHRVYWEPFCGSMAVLLSKPPCVMETVNDLHGDLTNLARVIQHPQLGPKLYRQCRRTWMAEGLFEDAAKVIRSDEASDEPDLDRACKYMLTTWLGRNGVAGTGRYNHQFCVRYTANGGHAAKRWDSVVRSIPAWHKRLRNVTILRRDAFIRIARSTATAQLIRGERFLDEIDPLVFSSKVIVEIIRIGRSMTETKPGRVRIHIFRNQTHKGIIRFAAASHAPFHVLDPAAPFFRIVSAMTSGRNGGNVITLLEYSV